MKILEKQGYHLLSILVLSGGIWLAAQGDILEGAFLVSSWHPDLDHAPSRAFVEAYRAAYAREPANTAALSYDVVMMLTRAVVSAGSSEPDRIRDAPAQPRRFVGVAGEYAFDGSGDPVRRAVVLRIEGGRPVIHSRIEP